MKDTSEPNPILYGILRFFAGIMARLVFRRQVLRNEIRGVEGPYVIVANHGCALDFVNLIGLTRRRLRFVVSHCIFSRLPCQKLVRRVGLIPKQQFQTKTSDLRTMKRVLQNGEPLVIFPAGLMCEDGLSTPIPDATWRFLKWLNVDIYAAHFSGTYLVMPKWASGVRPARTTTDVYRLITREELADMTEDEIRARVRPALLFDDYREQTERGTASRRFRRIEGLEHVLYLCPDCGAEFTTAAEKDTIRCTACGFAARSDGNGMLHRCGGEGPEPPYVSDWSRMIREHVRTQMQDGSLTEWEDTVRILILDPEQRTFADAGNGTLRYTRGNLHYTGILSGAPADSDFPVGTQPTLPFKPGHHIEIQQGDTVYRCLPEHPQRLMQLVNMVELDFEAAHSC